MAEILLGLGSGACALLALWWLITVYHTSKVSAEVSLISYFAQQTDNDPEAIRSLCDEYDHTGGLRKAYDKLPRYDR
jgi:hypothetical protein